MGARRTLRALRRAGERRSHIESDKLSRAGIAGKVCSFISVNFFLHMVGLEMVAFRQRRFDSTDSPNNEVTAELKDLKDLDGYRSDEGPDDFPDSDDTLEDSESADDLEGEDYVSNDSR